jgi:transaldolase
MNAPRQLHDLGQILWLDNITRGIVDDGTPQRYISDLLVTGLTSSPTIFDHAISRGDTYDDAIRDKRSEGKADETLFFELGKKLAQRIGGELQGNGSPADGHDSSTTALIRRYVQARDRSAT